MRTNRAVMGLLLTAVLAAGCGGSDSDSDAAGTTAPAWRGGTATAPTSSPTTTVAVATDPALAAKAKAATLQGSDFTAGFEEQPEEPGQGLGIDALWAELTKCLGVETTRSAGKATSPTIKRGLATQGRSTVEYPTQPAPDAIAAAFTGPKADGCLQEAFVADLARSKPEGSTSGPVRVAPRDVPPVGDRVLAWRINASVNLEDLVVSLFQDFLVIVDGPALIRMWFLNPGSEFPQELERSLVEKVVSRA